MTVVHTGNQTGTELGQQKEINMQPVANLQSN